MSPFSFVKRNIVRQTEQDSPQERDTRSNLAVPIEKGKSTPQEHIPFDFRENQTWVGIPHRQQQPAWQTATNNNNNSRIWCVCRSEQRCLVVMDSNVRQRNANKKLAFKAPTEPSVSVPDEASRPRAVSYSRCPALALPLCRKSYLEAAREGWGLTQIPHCPRLLLLLLLLPVSPRSRCCARAWRLSSAQRRPAPATEHSTRGGRH